MSKKNLSFEAIILLSWYRAKTEKRVNAGWLSQFKRSKSLWYFDGEDGFYEAHNKHLKAADSLIKKNFYIMSYLELLIAIECFFKDIFCIIRYEILQDYDLETISYSDNVKWGKRLISKNVFGHDVFSLVYFTQEIFVNLKNNSDYSILRGLLSSERGEWIELRYYDPKKYLTRDFKNEYNELLSVFNDVRTDLRILGCFK